VGFRRCLKIRCSCVEIPTKLVCFCEWGSEISHHWGDILACAGPACRPVNWSGKFSLIAVDSNLHGLTLAQVRKCMHSRTIWGVHYLSIIYLETRKIYENGLLNKNVCFSLLCIFNQNIFHVDKYLTSYAHCACMNGGRSSFKVTKMFIIPKHSFSVLFDSTSSIMTLVSKCSFKPEYDKKMFIKSLCQHFQSLQSVVTVAWLATIAVVTHFLK
jgi:hypothetical protein